LFFFAKIDRHLPLHRLVKAGLISEESLKGVDMALANIIIGGRRWVHKSIS
jgi:hypothetical protein